MPNNTLFHFIKTNTPSLASLLGRGVRIVPDTNKDGHHYLRFDLVPVGPFALGDGEHRYTLQAHHISVYEMEHSSTPELSQYHYTAYFQDTDGSRYQLHVYFNDQDEIVIQPAFSKIDGAGDCVSVAAQSMHEQFIDLAIRTVKPVIGLARQQLGITVAGLLLHCRTLEEEAYKLSASIAEHPEVYGAKLEELCLALQNLIPLSRHDHYQKKEQFIQQMIVALKRPIATVHTASGAATEEREASPAAGAVVPSREAVLDAPPLILLDERIETLVTRFSELNDRDELIYANALSAILNEIYELSVLLTEEHNAASPLALNKLQKLHSDVCSVGEKLFARLLLREEFALLEKLPAFYYLLTDKYLTYALQTRKHQLLDFILTHGDFVLNDHPLIIKGKTYPSAVHYCFGEDSESTPMCDCLSVLMKHNASIIVPNQRGLPIAHLILSTIDHPLKRAFISPEVKSKTLYSVSFYERLIAELTRYLAKPSLDVTERLVIEREINIYKNELLILKSSHEGGRLRKAVSDLSENPYIKLYIDHLKRDPEFIRLNEMLKLYRNTLFRKLTHKEKMVIENKSADLMHDVDAYLQHLDLGFCSYNDIKHSSLNYLRDAIEVFKKRDRLVDVQRELKKPRYGHVSKAVRALVEEEQELIRTINILARKYIPPTPDEEDTFFADIRGLLDGMKEMARRIKEALAAFEASEPETETPDVSRSALQRLSMFTPPAAGDNEDTGPVVKPA